MPDKHSLLRTLTAEIGKPGMPCASLQVIELSRTRPDAVEDALAHRIHENIRGHDLVARIDDHTLAGLFRDVRGTAEAIAIAQRMLGLAGPTDPNEDAPSIGIVMLTGQSVPAALVIAQAHTAALRAQQYSCGRWELWHSRSESSPESLALQAERWARRIHTGLDRGEFRLHYQPQLALGSASLIGVEALVRWQQDDRLVPPGDFIPAAENNGSIVQLGEWVLDEACRQMAVWQREETICPRIAVNVSAHQLRGGIVDTVWRTLARHRLSPGQLEIELTESALVNDPDEARAITHELADLGVTLSLDDFGVGYSSFARLRNLPFNAVKIDHQFVSGMLEDSYDFELVRMLIDLAKKRDIITIAEGVEHTAQREMLGRMGCDAWQGYLCSPPLPAERVVPFFQGAALN